MTTITMEEQAVRFVGGMEIMRATDESQPVGYVIDVTPEMAQRWIDLMALVTDKMLSRVSTTVDFLYVNEEGEEGVRLDGWHSFQYVDVYATKTVLRATHIYDRTNWIEAIDPIYLEDLVGIVGGGSMTKLFRGDKTKEPVWFAHRIPLGEILELSTQDQRVRDAVIQIAYAELHQRNSAMEWARDLTWRLYPANRSVVACLEGPGQPAMLRSGRPATAFTREQTISWSGQTRTRTLTKRQVHMNLPDGDHRRLMLLIRHWVEGNELTAKEMNALYSWKSIFNRVGEAWVLDINRAAALRHWVEELVEDGQLARPMSLWTTQPACALSIGDPWQPTRAYDEPKVYATIPPAHLPDVTRWRLTSFSCRKPLDTYGRLLLEEDAPFDASLLVWLSADEIIQALQASTHIGHVFRVPSGYRHDKDATVADVVRYEELGNDLPEPPAYYERIPASHCLWVTTEKDDARRYLQDGQTDDCIKSLYIGPAIAVGNDPDGGMLVCSLVKALAGITNEAAPW